MTHKGFHRIEQHPRLNEYIQFFKRSDRYKYWGSNLIKSDLHLSGVGQGKIHLQRLIEFISSVPNIPLFMWLAAAMPREWTPERVYFMITITIGFFGWTTLTRRT